MGLGDLTQAVPAAAVAEDGFAVQFEGPAADTLQRWSSFLFCSVALSSCSIYRLLLAAAQGAAGAFALTGRLCSLGSCADSLPVGNAG